ncbi:hypothetical protein FAK_15060 [Desulfoferula mesophila]|uniref:Uncharacterized protein n=1 Tax=Desulfoferula mesophila TaxID=3058419 RepID=A0AAU9ERK0_9BACT|nr:hypothetical protein FAK_15060 [Desulfoferula mesophilus]
MEFFALTRIKNKAVVVEPCLVYGVDSKGRPTKGRLTRLLVQFDSLGRSGREERVRHRGPVAGYPPLSQLLASVAIQQEGGPQAAAALPATGGYGIKHQTRNIQGTAKAEGCLSPAGFVAGAYLPIGGPGGFPESDVIQGAALDAQSALAQAGHSQANLPVRREM